MTEHDSLSILDSLQSGPGVLLDALRGVTSELAVRVPDPGKWSVLQCVEHMALSEEFLLSRLLAAEQSATPLVNEDREARLIARATDRTKPWKFLHSAGCRAAPSIQSASNRSIRSRSRPGRSALLDDFVSAIWSRELSGSALADGRASVSPRKSDPGDQDLTGLACTASSSEPQSNPGSREPVALDVSESENFTAFLSYL
jgi:hypothetical protein